jgi:hypothetical protein
MDVIVLMLVIFIAAAAFTAANARKSGKKPKNLDPLAESAPIEEAQVWSLKPGDLVKHMSFGDFLIRRTVSMRKGGYRWNEHFLDNAQGDQRWLSIEDDRGLNVGIWTEVGAAAVETGDPGDRNLTVNSKEYKVAERGTVGYTTTTIDGAPVFGKMEFVEYESADREMVICQKFDGFERWEIAKGERLDASDLEIYPATQS